LPVKFGVQGQYMPVHPDIFGQKWNLQFSITPVIPKLIKRSLFDFSVRIDRRVNRLSLWKNECARVSTHHARAHA